MWYLIFYAIGLMAGVVSPAEQMAKSLAILEPITLTALVASLLVPFAGFAASERWQRFALQYAIIPLFGMYSVVLWRESSVVGLILLVSATAVHAGYWTSGIHSRGYRLEQFKLGFADHWPDHARIIAILNAEGRSEAADDVVKSVISGSREEMTESCMAALKHLSDDQKGLLRKDYLLR